MKRAITITATNTPIKMNPTIVSKWNVKIDATMKIIGTGNTIWINIVKAVCMFVMSDIVLVVIEAVPNCLKSKTD